MSFARTIHALIALVPLAAALPSCADLEDDLAPASTEEGLDDAELNLIAVADRPNGNQLRFYEPGPGQILTVELGEGSTAPPSADAVALFTAMAPGVAVPVELRAAQERAASLRLADHADDRAAAPGGEMSLPPELAVDRPSAPTPIAAAGPCSLNTFIAEQCNDGDQEWCKLNWSGGHWASNPSVNFMHNAVCSLTGTVTLKLIVNSSLKASYVVKKGYIGKVVWIQPSLLPFATNRFGFYTEVTNASGDTFHVGGAAGDY